jgi:hypothetical protein
VAFKIIIEHFFAIAERNLNEIGNISAGFQPETSLFPSRTMKHRYFDNIKDYI